MKSRRPTIFIGDHPTESVTCARGDLRVSYDERSIWVMEKVLALHAETHGWVEHYQTITAARRSLEKYRPAVLRQLDLIESVTPTRPARPRGGQPA